MKQYIYSILTGFILMATLPRAEARGEMVAVRPVTGDTKKKPNLTDSGVVVDASVNMNALRTLIDTSTEILFKRIYISPSVRGEVRFYYPGNRLKLKINRFNPDGTLNSVETEHTIGEAGSVPQVIEDGQEPTRFGTWKDGVFSLVSNGLNVENSIVNSQLGQRGDIPMSLNHMQRVFRPSNGVLYTNDVYDGLQSHALGQAGDQPFESIVLGMGIYRPSTGRIETHAYYSGNLIQSVETGIVGGVFLSAYNFGFFNSATYVIIATKESGYTQAVAINLITGERTTQAASRSRITSFVLSGNAQLVPLSAQQ